ncbi:MAG: hypothetical protein EOP83_13205, partial [Verrucomicrobiaceae bacterium]
MKTGNSNVSLSLPTTTTRHHLLRLAGLLVGTSVLGSSSVFAGTWNGSVSTDWNTVANWTSGLGGTTRVDTTTPRIATITANFADAPSPALAHNQILVGVGATAVGRVDHISGLGTVAAGNALTLGRQGGNGTYNLANTAVAGAGLTGFAQGSGSLTIPGQIFVGGAVSGVSTGALNINTTGTISAGTQLLVGSFGGTGTVKMESGTLTVGTDMEIGNGASATGTLTQTGGTITKTSGATAVTIGGGVSPATSGGNGTANLNGGTFTTPGVLRVGHGNASNGTLNLGGTNLTVGGEFWVGNQTGGTGTMTYSSGAFTVNNWVLIGRKDDANVGVGGIGSVSMTGGTWTKSGESNFIVGDTGAGTMTMSGGLVVVNPHSTADRGITWIANRNSCTGSLTISGSAEFRTPRIVLGVEALTNATLNLNGGTLKTSSITGGAGDTVVNFNGTQIIATGSSDAFLDTLLTADIGAGGLKVDTAGFNLSGLQAIGGTGDITKSGAGTLKLLGSNTYSGNNVVNGGKLLLSVETAATGDTTVANGAGFGVVQQSGFSSLDQTNLTFGSASGATTLDIDLGDNFGNPGDALLNVTGTLTLNGPVTINVQDLDPDVGTIPLVSYAAPKAGGGSFVQGTLPLGVSGHIEDTVVGGVGTVSLVVDTLAFPVWAGEVNGTVDTNWDLSTLNWRDDVTTNPIAFADGLPVIFGEVLLPESANITLNTTVTPGSMRFDAFGAPYTISGTGKISGSTGLIQAGTTDLTISTANDFTGPVEIFGGTTFINSVSNAGSAASLGAGTTPILLNGGNLNYT